MTREEAINIMSQMIKDEEGFLSDNTVEAHKMAIKALEQEPKTDTWSIKDVANTFKKHGLIVEQEPCEDAIDRKLVCAFIAGLISDDGERKKGLEYIRNMPPVTPQPCEDAISRQAVIDSLHSKFADGSDSDRWWNSMSVLYAINKVPPVNPTKTGHCKDCKWWKDSDGTYCRGVHAESKCPINRKEVYEGNGYCYMFEPQESEAQE